MTKRQSRAHNARPRIRARMRDPQTADLVAYVVHAATDTEHSVTWPDEYDTAEAPAIVYALLRGLRYVADDDTQVIKAPHVLLDTGVGDCKSFSVCAAKLLKAAGYRVRLRFVTNTDGGPYEHVYVIAEKSGHVWIVDGVWHTFDAEPPHFQSVDVVLT